MNQGTGIFYVTAYEVDGQLYASVGPKAIHEKVRAGVDVRLVFDLVYNIFVATLIDSSEEYAEFNMVQAINDGIRAQRYIINEDRRVAHITKDVG